MIIFIGGYGMDNQDKPTLQKKIVQIVIREEKMKKDITALNEKIETALNTKNDTALEEMRKTAYEFEHEYRQFVAEKAMTMYALLDVTEDFENN